MITIVLILLNILIVLAILVKKTIYKEKIVVKFFLIPFVINLLVIFLRFYQLITRTFLETVYFIIPVGVFSIIFLIHIGYIKLILKYKKAPTVRNRRVITPIFEFFKTVFIFLSTLFLELHRSYEIFVLATFKNQNWLGWCQFFSRYLLLLPIEKIILIPFIFLAEVLFLLLNFELAQNKIFLALVFLFLFNLTFRLTQAILYFFFFLNNFRYVFLGKNYWENYDNFFYGWEFLKIFDLPISEREKKVPNLMLFLKAFQETKRLSLFIRLLNDIKTKIDCFFCFLFILHFFKLFFYPLFGFFADFLIFILFFCLIFQTLLVLIFSNKETQEFNSWVKAFDYWSNNNTVGFLWYISNDPFISSFAKRIKSLFVSRYHFVHFLPTRRRISYRFFNYDPSIINFLYDIRAIFILVFCFFVYFLFFYFNSVTLFFLANFAYFRDLLWIIIYFWYNFIFFEPFFFNLDFPKIIFFGILIKDIVKITFLIFLSFFK